MPTLTVLANLGYEITSDVDWISPDKPTGRGQTEVVLDIEENTTGGVRTGHLTISSKELQEKVTVIQTMDLDTDDGQDNQHNQRDTTNDHENGVDQHTEQLGGA